MGFNPAFKELNLMSVLDVAVQEELVVWKAVCLSFWQGVDEWRWVTAEDDSQT
jgi:hypothetical protein